MIPTITCIIPTVGRDTLGRAIRSARDADEILVCPNWHGDRGYRARNEAMQRATGSHIALLDDDDVYTPGAIGHMRAAACDLPVIFRMRYATGAGGTLWREQRLEFGNVGTPMFLVPNVAEKLGRWQPWGPSDTGGDCSFISETVERFGDVVWNKAVVALIRPE